MRTFSLLMALGVGLTAHNASADAAPEDIAALPPSEPVEAVYYVSSNRRLDTREGMVWPGGWPGQEGHNMKLCGAGEEYVTVDLTKFLRMPERRCGNAGWNVATIAINLDMALAQEAPIAVFGADQSPGQVPDWVVRGFVPAQTADGGFAGMRAYILGAAEGETSGTDELRYIAAMGCSLNAAEQGAAVYCDSSVADLAAFGTDGFVGEAYAPMIDGDRRDTGLQVFLPDAEIAMGSGADALERFGSEGFGVVTWEDAPASVELDLDGFGGVFAPSMSGMALDGGMSGGGMRPQAPFQ